jgi:hypothetical protein
MSSSLWICPQKVSKVQASSAPYLTPMGKCLRAAWLFPELCIW